MYIESHIEIVLNEMMSLINTSSDCCNFCYRRTNDCANFGIEHCYYWKEVSMLRKSLGRIMNGPEK